jgi:hypothetical protein
MQYLKHMPRHTPIVNNSQLPAFTFSADAKQANIKPFRHNKIMQQSA